MFKTPVQKLKFRRDSGDSLNEDVSFNSLSSGSASDEICELSFEISSPEGWNPALATPNGSPRRSRSRLLLPDNSPIARISSRNRSISPELPNVRLSSKFCAVVSPTSRVSSPLPTGTPPHNRLRNLRLFDSPQTPKSLLQQQKQEDSSAKRRNRAIAGRLFSVGKDENSTNVRQGRHSAERGKRNAIVVNVNPFTASVLQQSAAKKRQRQERR